MASMGRTQKCKGCGGDYFTHPPVYTNEDYCEDCADRLKVNPEPLKSVKVKRCTGCAKKAPWCSCGKADYR